MSADLQCPYCGTYREQPDETNESGTVHEAECSGCNKIFGFTVDWFPSFDEFKLPCANGENHDWVEMCGFPTERFINWRRCLFCNEQKTLEQIAKEN